MRVLELVNEAIIVTDLAGTLEKLAGWAFWENKKVKTNLIYTDEEILDGVTRTLIDPMTVASTEYLQMQSRTEALGDEEEDYVIVPKKQDWRTLQI